MADNNEIYLDECQVFDFIIPREETILVHDITSLGLTVPPMVMIHDARPIEGKSTITTVTLIAPDKEGYSGHVHVLYQGKDISLRRPALKVMIEKE